MPMNRVEQALGMMRVFLVERAARNEWGAEGTEELAQTILACLGDKCDGSKVLSLERDQRAVRKHMRRAIRYVNENLDSKLKWDDIAAAVGMDPFTFGRSFKLASGMTPHQYIIRCRLRRAMRLLAKEDTSIADIAYDVGCSCQSHLTTLFRKHLGTTPNAYRALAREQSQYSSNRLGYVSNDQCLTAAIPGNVASSVPLHRLAPIDPNVRLTASAHGNQV
jgi:AraC-like DNA-binding protein